MAYIPEDFHGIAKMTTHQELDARSLAMHRLIAEKIRNDPALFDRAKSTLARWRKIVCSSSQPYLEEWERLLGQGIEASLAVAVEDSEYATALRQSSPFCGILTEPERHAFLKDWKNRDASLLKKLADLEQRQETMNRAADKSS